MLHPVATQRITVAGIMVHPWFLIGLPAGAAEMNSYFLEYGTGQQDGEECAGTS